MLWSHNIWISSCAMMGHNICYVACDVAHHGIADSLPHAEAVLSAG